MPRNFQQWFPQFAPYFSQILRDNCSSEYQAFLGEPDLWPNHRINTVVSCMLNHIDESGKAQMAAASVLLGILPTILGMVGSNITEVGLLALRQPILAILLSLGAPVVSPIRSFDYRSPVDILKTIPDAIQAFTKCQQQIYLVKYMIAVAAIGNVVHVIWQLCVYSVCVFSGSTWWLPALWAGVSVIPHLLGAYAVRLKLRVVPHRSLFAAIVASFLTILHLVMGTVVLSSALFISPSDAVVLSIRLLSSAVVCRVLLMFELHIIRHFSQL
ncbi:hypothetical protein COCMIDRAFT_36196 [Bipolaris oryzae ATCC 44560]|uniref:Uncharacterized protein n=1 Tax=Bipolaris oryzae ATCC 44560 TaxID=930090 RepID=W6Z8J0_COCMI|nr:uncharacterized protein COCMIDRAFT_36196 [Bipolaris oryzae ATCC 44560]EUC46108.1 hypothetical protein COCMIDRAFT_36196 [Bipolaris oryzae ATCC 44560]